MTTKILAMTGLLFLALQVSASEDFSDKVLKSEKWFPKTEAERKRISKIITSRDYEANKKLLESGMHPDLAGRYDGTAPRGGSGLGPISFFVSNKPINQNSIDLINLYIDYGSDLNIVDQDNPTDQISTVYTWIRGGECFDENDFEIKIAKLLIKRGYKGNTGAWVRSGFTRWMSALHKSTFCGPVAQLLFDNGADPAEGNCQTYVYTLFDYQDSGGRETDLEFQELGYFPHTLNYFRNEVTKRYGNGRPDFNPDKYCKDIYDKV